MLEIKYSDKKCRLWINQKPDISYRITDIIEKKFNADIFLNQSKHITIEILLPRNASYYALLGAEFVPDNSGMLTVSIEISAFEKDIFENNISYEFEKVMCGIPEEYGNSIINYIRQNTDKIKLPSGKLNFDIGAYGIIGSSQSIFAMLTKVILKLLQIDFNDIENVKHKVLNYI